MGLHDRAPRRDHRAVEAYERTVREAPRLMAGHVHTLAFASLLSAEPGPARHPRHRLASAADAGRMLLWCFGMSAPMLWTHEHPRRSEEEHDG